MLWRPVPSRLMATRTRVSWVLRVISAVRMSGLGVGGFKAVFGAGGVCRQTFAACKDGGDAAQRLCARLRHLDQAGALLKVVNAQWRGEPGRTRGGQHVVGARAVVAQRFRGVRPQEDGAGVADAVCP